MARAEVRLGVPPGEADPRAAHLRAGRADAAAQVRREEQAVRPGRRAGGHLDHLLVQILVAHGCVLPAAGVEELVAEPAQRDARRRRCRPAGSTSPGMTERMVSSARFFVSATKRSVQPASTAAVPATSNSMPGAHDARAQGIGRRVARTRRRSACRAPAQNPAAGPAAPRRSRRHGSTICGQLVHVQPEPLAQLLRPGAAPAHRANPEKWMKV